MPVNLIPTGSRLPSPKVKNVPERAKKAALTKGSEGIKVTQKRYQVFVSSTYEDLLMERQEVMKALLESECIPTGMELFPAADEDAWTLIRRVIDESDYYILILAGRYGSISPAGISYTEQEYRYALERGKPVIGFLHGDPDSIPTNKTERGEEAQQRLRDFRQLVRRKLTKNWNSPGELAAVVGRSIEALKREKPAVGWVRADVLPESDQSALAAYEQRISELQARVQDASTDLGERPEVLIGSTYEVKTPVSDFALYVTINDVVLNEGKPDERRRAYELIVTTNGPSDLNLVALSRVVSMNLRQGVDPRAVVNELKGVFDPRGGYWQPGGKFMPSIIAELGYVLEKHLITIGTLSPTDQTRRTHRR